MKPSAIVTLLDCSFFAFALSMTMAGKPQIEVLSLLVGFLAANVTYLRVVVTKLQPKGDK